AAPPRFRGLRSLAELSRGPPRGVMWLLLVWHRSGAKRRATGRAAPSPARPVTSRRRPAVLGQVLPDLLQVVRGGLAGSFLPGEDAHGGDAVEVHLGEGPEEDVPVHLALTDVQVLVDAGGRTGRVDDVPQPGGGAVVEGIGDVQMGEQRPGVLDDAFDVAALVEGVRRAVQERDPVLVDAADEVDGRPAVLDEVVRVRFEHQPDALALEDG